jgi:ribosomal protein S18 acetylase RimI-like enzyme
MSQDIIVRPARTEDIAGLSVLATRAFRDTYSAHNDPAIVEDYVRSSLTPTSMRNEIDEAGNVFLIAFRGGDGVAIGYAKLCTTSEDPAIGGQSTVEIERIYADKRVIGHGVGAALMRACLDTAIEVGCETIWLGVWERNKRAILFYERWEFKTVGARQFALGPELQNDLVMARHPSQALAE